MNKNTSVALQSYTATRSATGAEVRTWTTYATVQAGVKDLRGEAYYAQEQTANQIVMEIYIWYRTDIVPKHRAVIGSVTYEIESVVNIRMENREMLLRLRRVE